MQQQVGFGKFMVRSSLVVGVDMKGRGKEQCDVRDSSGIRYDEFRFIADSFKYKIGDIG